jgi:hypothetical protein
MKAIDDKFQDSDTRDIQSGFQPPGDNALFQFVTGRPDRNKPHYALLGFLDIALPMPAIALVHQAFSKPPSEAATGPLHIAVDAPGMVWKDAPISDNMYKWSAPGGTVVINTATSLEATIYLPIPQETLRKTKDNSRRLVTAPAWMGLMRGEQNQLSEPALGRVKRFLTQIMSFDEKVTLKLSLYPPTRPLARQQQATPGGGGEEEQRLAPWPIFTGGDPITNFMAATRVESEGHTRPSPAEMAPEHILPRSQLSIDEASLYRKPGGRASNTLAWQDLRQDIIRMRLSLDEQREVIPIQERTPEDLKLLELLEAVYRAPEDRLQASFFDRFPQHFKPLLNMQAHALFNIVPPLPTVTTSAGAVAQARGQIQLTSAPLGKGNKRPRPLSTQSNEPYSSSRSRPFQ